MPLIRKVIEIGHGSRGLIVPASWLQYAEREAGHQIDRVTIEVDGDLVIRPYLPPKEEVATT